jgi:hypothetical protein
MGWKRAISAGIALLGLSACGVGGLTTDRPDGGPDPDDPDGGGPPTRGVSVEFVILGPNEQPARGEDPLEFPEFRIDSVVIQIHDLRLIGDTAPSGDLVLESRAIDFPATEELVSFAMAPPGLYSRITFDVERAWADEDLPGAFEGQRLSVRVRGEAKFGNKKRRFDYVDDTPPKITTELDFGEEVTPGQPGSVIVELNIRQWFSDVDWNEVDARGPGNDPIQIGMGSNMDVAQLLRDRMAKAFEVRE